MLAVKLQHGKARGFFFIPKRIGNNFNAQFLSRVLTCSIEITEAHAVALADYSFYFYYLLALKIVRFIHN